jgi:hypothetical protein
MKKIEFNLENTSIKFVQEIEKLVLEKGYDYIDAVVSYCKTNNIEIESAASIIKTSSKIKSRVRLEGENLNILKKTVRLPE